MSEKYFWKILPFMKNVGGKKYDTTRQATDDNGSCALQAGYLRLQTHTQNM
jgi:hypothetical protein